MEHEFNEPTLFDCSNQIRPLQCKRCPHFRTYFFAHLRQHIRSGHKEAEMINKRLQWSFVTSSRNLHLRHSMFNGFTMDEEEKKKRCVSDTDCGIQSALPNKPTDPPQESRKDVDLCKSGASINARTESSEGNCIELSCSRPRSWKCKQCKYKCNYEHSLRNHITYCHSKTEADGSLKCDQCLSEFKRKSQLGTHIVISHSEPKDVTSDVTYWFKCDQCPYESNCEHDVVNHRSYRHSQVHWYKCDQCPFKGKFESDLTKHTRYRHSKPQDIHWFKCGQCGFQCMFKRDLTSHIIQRHSEPEDVRLFRCDQCPSKYERKMELELHVKYRHAKPEDIQWFKCDQCPSQFKHRVSWERHRHT